LTTLGKQLILAILSRLDFLYARHRGVHEQLLPSLLGRGVASRCSSADAGSGAHTATYTPFVLTRASEQSLPQELQVCVPAEADGWTGRVEMTRKSRSPAALLSPRQKRDRAARDAAGPRTPWAMGQRGEGAKGLLAEPGSSVLVKQESDFVCFAEPSSCLRRTLCLEESPGGDLFIVTGMEATGPGSVPAPALCSPLRGRSLFTPSSLRQHPTKMQRGGTKHFGIVCWRVSLGRLQTRLRHGVPDPAPRSPGPSAAPDPRYKATSERRSTRLLTPLLLFLFQGSAPILVVMVILLNIGVAILFINFFI